MNLTETEKEGITSYGIEWNYRYWSFESAEKRLNFLLYWNI